jgi:hypothetical protein
LLSSAGEITLVGRDCSTIVMGWLLSLFFTVFCVIKNL